MSMKVFVKTFQPTFKNDKEEAIDPLFNSKDYNGIWESVQRSKTKF